MVEKQCTCGKTKGVYTDSLNAVYTGPCVPLGFSNQSFRTAIESQPERDFGKEFIAFVVEKQCPTMKRGFPQNGINFRNQTTLQSACGDHPDGNGDKDEHASLHPGELGFDGQDDVVIERFTSS